MKTDDLIESLSEGLEPVHRHAVAARLMEGAGAGVLVSLALMWAWLGFRPDLVSAMATGPYWMKFGYTLAFALFAYWATARLARPGARPDRPMIGMGAVFAALFIVGASQLMAAEPGARMHLVMGNSAHVCPWRIVILAAPIFAGTFWSLHGLAPTRLTLAGLVAGFASGAAGAWIYAFHCDESAAPFVLVFYTLGFALMGLAGAAIARRALRW